VETARRCGCGTPRRHRRLLGARAELWAAPINSGIPGTPTRVNAPLAPDEQISWYGWGGDGKRLAYRTGTYDLFIVDMTGPVPSTPKVLANVPSFSWSPNGRYLARVEHAPASSGFRIGVVNLDDPVLAWRNMPEGTYEDLRNFSWSANSEWIFGLAPDMFLWSVRVTATGPEAFSGTYTGAMEPVGFWPSPVGAEYALLMNFGAPDGKYVVAVGNPSGYSPVTDAWGGLIAGIHTEFVDWMPNGDLLYIGQPPGVDLSAVCQENDLECRFHLLNDCGHLRVFAVPAVPGSRVEFWQAAPDGRAVAVRVSQYGTNAPDPFSEPVFLWKRHPETCWAPAVEVSVTLPSTDRYFVDPNWGPDSRTLLVYHAPYPSYSIIDTHGAPPYAPTAIALPRSMSNRVWANRSMRLFYDSIDVHSAPVLGYVDLRSGTPTVPTIVSPTFAEPRGHEIDWGLSPDDDYVAMRAGFTQIIRYELYITDLRGTSPRAPVRVNAPLGGSRSVTAFEWQPGLANP
jgi:hypothetical protein